MLSQATAGIVEDDELLDVRLRDLGDHLLKDISLPQRLFQIEADGLPSEFPPLGTRIAAGTIATLLAIDLAGWRRVMDELGDDGAAARSFAPATNGGTETGYPDGLAAEAIPVASRIVCACDAFEAMTTTRPYREARTIESALAELERCSGTQFDPTVVGALMTLVRERIPAV